MKTAKEYHSLFQGLDEGYGEEIDGKIKNVKEPPTLDVIKAHLFGKRKIGIYPLKRNHNVNWACMDFDGETARAFSRKCFDIASKIGLNSQPEISSSGVGRHLWFFFTREVPGWKARCLLGHIQRLAGLGEEPKVEIFPKQDFLPANRWGNFVFLPLQGKLKKQRKTILLNWGQDIEPNNYKISPELLSGFVPERLNPKKKQINLGKKTAEEIFDLLGIELPQLRKEEDELWALCPFHPETEASWSIHNKELVYHCFGCGASGYIDELIKEITGEEFADIAKQERLHVETDRIWALRDGDYVEIADFGFTIERIYKDQDIEEGIQRDIVFRQGNLTVKAIGYGRDFTSRMNFNNFTMSQGPYHFMGTEKELARLIKEEDEKATAKGVCRITRKYGFIDGDFLTKAFLVRKNKIYEPNDEGIVKVGNNSIKLASIKGSLDFYPFSNGSIPDIAKKVEKEKLLNQYKKTYPGLVLPTAIGWVLASMYSEEIKEKYSIFPMLFITGPNSSGKTWLARNILALWGMEPVITIGKGSSYVGVKRILERGVGIPICIDDYRNIYSVQEKDGLLRSSYDGIAGYKGTKERGGSYEELATATLILTGEELPEDTALRARCAVLRISSENQGTRANFNKLRDMVSGMSNIILKELLSKSPKRWESIIKYIDKLTAEFYRHTQHQRQALIWAIPTAFHFALMEKPTKAKIIRVLKESGIERVEREQEDIISDFFETMAVLIQQTKINEREHFYIDNTGFLYIWLKPCYGEWADSLARKRKNPPSYGRLRTELEGKSWVVNLTSYPRSGLTSRRRCAKISLTNMPIDLAKIFQDEI